MEQALKHLWLNPKEIQIYLYLVEFGVSGASEIGKRIGIPKSTVNFIADHLTQKLFLHKTFKGNTGLYGIDLWLLKDKLEQEIQMKQDFLKHSLPKLKEKNKHVKTKPKIKFFDGVEACKSAYLDILKIQGSFYEFWAHRDLEESFWKKFMKHFIEERNKRSIFCESIGTDGKVELDLQKLDTKQMRHLKIFPSSFWSISSSIVIYEESVLLLNLRGICNGVLIENRDFAQTMKTIFHICTRKK